MPSTNTFDAKLKFELSQCDSLPSTSEASIVERLGSVSNCRVVADRAKSAAAPVGQPNPKWPTVIIKPGSLHKARLFIVRPLVATVVPKDKPNECLETPIDGILDRDALAQKLTFQVEPVPPSPGGATPYELQLGRAQVYYDGLIDLLLLDQTGNQRDTAQLTFFFDPQNSQTLFTDDAKTKFSEVKSIVIQVIAAYSAG